MKAIRSLIIVTIVLATSLSAMQNENDEKSLKNLCLNHFAQNVPQAIELITGNKAPVSLRLELMLKLKKDTIEQYHEALWNYIKTFTNPKDDDLLLMADIANKMPEQFLKSHKNEIIGLPFTIKCQLVENNPCLQTRKLFKSLCTQGSITAKIAKLMAKRFSLEDKIAYKKGEYLQNDMRAHGNEKTLLRAFIHEYIGTIEPRLQREDGRPFRIFDANTINFQLQFKEDGNLWLSFEPEITSNNHPEEKIHEYPIDSLDTFLAMVIYSAFKHGRNYELPRKDPASLNPSELILRFHDFANRIDLLREVTKAIQNNQFDKLSELNCTKEMLMELELIKIFFDEIILSEIPIELIENYKEFSRVGTSCDFTKTSIGQEMAAIKKKLEPHIDAIARLTDNYIHFNSLQQREKDVEFELDLSSIHISGYRLLHMYKQIQKKYTTLNAAVEELDQTVANIEAIATKFYRPQAALYRKIINQLIPFFKTVEEQYSLIMQLLLCGPIDDLDDIEYVQEFFQNLIAAATNNIGICRGSVNQFRQLRHILFGTDMFLKHCCDNIEKFNQLLAEFKQQPLLSCFTKAQTYFELYQSKVIPQYIKAKNKLDYPPTPAEDTEKDYDYDNPALHRCIIS